MFFLLLGSEFMHASLRRAVGLGAGRESAFLSCLWESFGFSHAEIQGADGGCRAGVTCARQGPSAAPSAQRAETSSRRRALS